MKNEKIEVTLVTGFLGSGKTTFLNQYMNEVLDENNKVALIVNEFGDFDVDGHLLEKTPLSLTMLQGCICCDLQDDLVMQLQQLAQQNVTHVVIEATGIANPIEMIAACQDPLIARQYTYPTIITIVDSVRFAQRETLSEATRTLMIDQIRASQYILLNKIDLLDTSEMQEKVVQDVTQFAPHSTIEWAKHGVVQKTVKTATHMNQIEHMQRKQLHAHYDTISYHFTYPISREQFIQFILNVPESVLRMKGYVQFRDVPNELFLVQYAGGLPSLESVGNLALPTTVVIIGERLDKPALKNKLELLQFG
ncbi:CobW family GTP-binding protein [Staphylococcus americanisciuri]|uniref:GTP-binding protein n=1 Tax=Staphylococcus americanisciuri TaxID=2973940 RepID=A0ABT2F2E6_9STAP|nr:GTP-binding protein [Staphylococcus americanisciuri]MCS4486446.1 GTP-binding protein [Staphylococcus americanisciuri]